MAARSLKPEEYRIVEEPYYEATGNEIAVFEAAYRNKLAVSLRGPTGCGGGAAPIVPDGGPGTEALVSAGEQAWTLEVLDLTNAERAAYQGQNRSFDNAKTINDSSMVKPMPIRTRSALSLGGLPVTAS